MKTAIYTTSNGYFILHDHRGYRVIAPGLNFLGRTSSLPAAMAKVHEHLLGY